MIKKAFLTTIIFICALQAQCQIFWKTFENEDASVTIVPKGVDFMDGQVSIMDLQLAITDASFAADPEIADEPDDYKVIVDIKTGSGVSYYYDGFVLDKGKILLDVKEDLVQLSFIESMWGNASFSIAFFRNYSNKTGVIFDYDKNKRIYLDNLPNEFVTLLLKTIKENQLFDSQTFNKIFPN